MASSDSTARNLRFIERELGLPLSPTEGFPAPETAFFWLGRTPAALLWTAAYHANGIFCYGDKKETFKKRLIKAAKLANLPYQGPDLFKTSARGLKRNVREAGFKFQASIALLDFSEDEPFKELEDVKGFKYKHSNDPIKTLKALEAYYILLQEQTKKSHYIVNKREGLLLFLHFDNATLTEIKANPETLSFLENFFEKASKERVYPILALEDASYLTSTLAKHSSLTVFMGEENSILAERLYKQELTTESFPLEIRGRVWDNRKPETLQLFATVELERAAWAEERSEIIEAQAQAWEEYLKDLEDLR